MAAPLHRDAVLVLVGFFIRRNIAESPSFQKLGESGGIVEIPIVTVLRKHSIPVLLGIGAKLGEITLFWLFAVFVLSFATKNLGLAKVDILNATTAGAVLMFLFMPIFGLLSDRYCKRTIFNIGLSLVLVSSVPLFLIIGSGNLTLIAASIIFALGFLYSIMYAPEASLLAELFPVEVRYTGLSLCANLGGAIGGGIAPIAATWLLSTYASISSVGVYLSAIAAVSLFSTLAMKAAVVESGR